MTEKPTIEFIFQDGMHQVVYDGRIVCQSINKDLALRKALYYLGKTCICKEGRCNKK